MAHFVSACCGGEKCHCGAPAEHKVEEEIFLDDPRWREWVGHKILTQHPLTAYICHKHFREIMGPAADGGR